MTLIPILLGVVLVESARNIEETDKSWDKSDFKAPLFFSLLKAVFVLFGAISIVAAAILIAAAIPDIHHRWLLANY